MTERFTAQEKLHEGIALAVLSDSHTGASASIWPGFGCNCVQLSLAAPGRDAVELIAPPRPLEFLRSAPSRWGTPILFPWPGRVPDAAWTWNGQALHLQGLDATGNAIHGLVKDEPWRISRLSSDCRGASVLCSISSADLPDSLEGYPFDWRLSLEFRLHGDVLEMHVEVANVGDRPLPFGFGAHPYFTVPFGLSGNPQDCLVRIPAFSKWDLDRLKNIRPRGGAPGTGGLIVPLPAGENLASPTPLGSPPPNAALTGLEMPDGWTECELIDPASDLTLSVRSSADFQTVVLFAPSERNAFCIEPWTCPPNVFNAAASGEAGDAGLLTVDPARHWQGDILLSLRSS